MKMTSIIISVITILSLISFDTDKSVVRPVSSRVTTVVNSGWTFNYFPENSEVSGIELPGFDDSKWPVVSIPHTWSTYETTGELHPYIRNAAESDNPYWWTGWGWYRKHFSVDEAYSGRRIFAEFEGVMKYCRVWINGKYLGDHKGGYGSFDFDLTDYINRDGDNLLVVAVNNERKDKYSTPPMAAGNYNVYGGIYRDVTIVLKDNLYIPMQGSASHEGGTFITTPGISKGNSAVRIQTWVKNENKESRTCTLRTTVCDSAGRKLQVVTGKATIKPGELYMFDQTTKPVSNPKLWSPETPCLYKVISEVIEGRKVTDHFESPFGFRWFSWDYTEDFLYVNGKKTVLHGGNRHQEYPWLGDAIPKWITEMDFRDMALNLNYNFMRTAHYPNDKLVYELTDKYGIIIDEESPSIKNQVFSVEVQEQQMKEMIRRDRNHPSIMFWGMGNETNHAVDSKYAVAEDTTRILTARRVSDGSAGKFVKHTDENLSLENLLRCTIRGWYNSDVKNLSPNDAQHCGTEDHHQNMLIKSGRLGTGNLSVWLYEDHGADREYLNAPLLHVNPKGYVDSYRIPKYGYYLWQATYHDKPMVFIQPHFWRRQYLGQRKDINISSNCDTVELFVNGKSMGVLYPNEKNFHNVTFSNIVIAEGKISAEGRMHGRKVSTAVVMAGEPSKIVLSASHSRINADLGSVVIIKADITDSEGNHVYGAVNTVRWSVKGPATLVGPQLYESDINKHHAMEGTMYTDMPVANIIRSSGLPGTITVVVSSPGLASGSCVIEADPYSPDNKVVIEKIPELSGRTDVVKNPKNEITATPVKSEIKYNSDEIFVPGRDKKGIYNYLAESIMKSNPGLDTTTTEFRAFINLCVNHTLSNRGRLIADDYNFFVSAFNSCRDLAGVVEAASLPQAFRDGLRRFYSGKIISEGMDVRIADEKDRINSIPSEGNILYVQVENSLSSGKVGVLTSEKDLKAITGIIHPEFLAWEKSEQDKVLEFIASLNPYIITTLKTDVIDNKKVTRAFYKVIPGEPIWIPAIGFLKNK